MNPREAIHVHAHWKLRIHSLLSGNSRERLDPAIIERDNLCELGKWLHAGNTRAIPREMHRALLAVHATFHQEAARIVREVQAAHLLGLDVIEPGSVFGNLSSQIVGMLFNLDPDSIE